MTDGVVIVGPSSPKALSRRLDGSDRARARMLPGLGGSPVNNLVHALLEAGASVELVTLAPELTERITLEGPGLRILAGPYRIRPRHHARDFFRAERRQVEELVAHTSGQVVNGLWTYEFALGALASPGRPTVVTAHDAPFTILRYMPDRYRLVRTAMALATRLRLSSLAANSPYLATVWRRQLLYRRAIPVIPNIVSPVSRTSNGARGGAGPPTILEVSDSGRHKNVGSLVRAMTQVLPSHPEARLRVVGPGLTDDSPLARLADHLGVRHAVEFVGHMEHDRLVEEYSRATIFVHASLEESFGMTVAEAMSHGLPVVGGANAGAVPWVLDKGRAGVLVNTRLPEEIAGAICRLLDDGALCAELRAAAKRRAQSAFSSATVAAGWMQVYDDVKTGRQ
jgi:glycosyltransferase involved in cell wall biosynthesis